MMDLDLKGKRAVVTGASLGIGEAVVKMLAEHGADVSFCARNPEAVDVLSSFESANGLIKGFVADMGNKESTDSFIGSVQEDGPVDILVNNVGASPSRNFLYMTDEDWQELHELNLLSAVRCTRAFLPNMREKKWGRVIMVSSSAGKYPNAALIDYGTTKAAMISMSKSLAKKYGSDGVLVNSILPGLIHTAMWERAATEIAEATGGKMEDVIKNNGHSVPVGRYGTSEEVASLITFLCTNAASYISGTSIEVDGGQSGHI
jgi:3-oxoacyl-[acyl-carrier protein] reductase